MITKTLINRYLALAITLVFTSAAWAIVPVAVWEGDFKTTSRGIISMDAQGNSVAEDGSTITINEGATQGVKFSWTGGRDGYTCIAKVRTLKANTDKSQVLFVGGANGNRTGVAWDTTGNTKGIWNNNLWTDAQYVQKEGALSSVDDSDTLYIAARHKSSNNGLCGTYLFVNTGSGWESVYESSGCRSNGDSGVYTAFSLGGPVTVNESAFVGASGMVIEKVAIFHAHLSQAEIAAYMFPSEIRPMDYSRWSNNPYIATWKGTANDLTTAGTSLFSQFDISDPTNPIDSDVTWGNGNNPVEIPGYGNYWAWSIFCISASANANHYQAPGNVLRFAADAGTPGALGAALGELAFGGLIIEPGAMGYSLVQSGTGRATGLGNNSIAADTKDIETWFDIRENFTINRTGTFHLYGTLNFDIEKGRTFDLNAAQSTTVGYYPTLQEETNAHLKMHGEGMLKVPTLVATGVVTLDFSDLGSRANTAPYIEGSLTVDDKTKINFPASIEEGEAYELCSGTLTAPEFTGILPIMIGDEQHTAILNYDIPNRSVSYTLAENGSKPLLLLNIHDSGDAVEGWFDYKTNNEGPEQLSISKETTGTIGFETTGGSGRYWELDTTENSIDFTPGNYVDIFAGTHASIIEEISASLGTTISLTGDVYKKSVMCGQNNAHTATISGLDPEKTYVIYLGMQAGDNSNGSDRHNRFKIESSGYASCSAREYVVTAAGVGTQVATSYTTFDENTEITAGRYGQLVVRLSDVKPKDDGTVVFSMQGYSGLGWLAVAEVKKSNFAATISGEVAFADIDWVSGSGSPTATSNVELTIEGVTVININSPIQIGTLNIKGTGSVHLAGSSLMAVRNLNATEFSGTIELDIGTVIPYSSSVNVGTNKLIYNYSGTEAITISNLDFRGDFTKCGTGEVTLNKDIATGTTVTVAEGTLKYTNGSGNRGFKGNLKILSGAIFETLKGDIIYWDSPTETIIDVYGTLKLGTYRWTLNNNRINLYTGGSIEGHDVSSETNGGGNINYLAGKTIYVLAEGGEGATAEISAIMAPQGSATIFDVAEGVTLVMSEKDSCNDGNRRNAFEKIGYGTMKITGDYQHLNGFTANEGTVIITDTAKMPSSNTTNGSVFAERVVLDLSELTSAAGTIFPKLVINDGVVFKFAEGTGPNMPVSLHAQELQASLVVDDATFYVGEEQKTATLQFGFNNNTVSYVQIDSSKEWTYNKQSGRWNDDGAWTDMEGNAHSWSEATSDTIAVFDAAISSSINVDGIFSPSMVILKGEGESFIFTNGPGLVDGEAELDGTKYCINAPILMNDYAGDLGLRVAVTGAITFGENTHLVFTSGDTVDARTRAYDYQIEGNGGAIGVSGCGTFIVPESMYNTAFDVYESATIEFDYVTGYDADITGKLSGAGRTVVALEAGKTIKFSNDNVGLTGDFIVKSGTVKMGHKHCFGAWGGNREIRVKTGATLDQNCVSNGGSYGGKSYSYIFEEAAKFVNFSTETTYDDRCKIIGTQMILEGDMTVETETAVGLASDYNFDICTVNLSNHTLTKTGSGSLYLARPDFVGTGLVDVTEGALELSKDWFGYDQGQYTIKDATIAIRGGAILSLLEYRGGTYLTAKNLILDGSVEMNCATNMLSVTGTLSGSGTAVRLTLKDGATVNCAADGAITITESLTFGNNIALQNVSRGDTVFALTDNTTVTSYPVSITVDGQIGDYRLVREGNSLKLRDSSATITMTNIPEGYSISKVTVDNMVIEPTEGTTFDVPFGANVGIVYTAADGSTKVQAILYAQSGNVVSAPLDVEDYSWGAGDNATILARASDLTPTAIFAGYLDLEKIANNESILTGKMQGNWINQACDVTFVKRSWADNMLKLQAQVFDNNITKAQNIDLLQVKCGDYNLIFASAATGFYVNDQEQDFRGTLITPETENYSTPSNPNAYEVVYLEMTPIAKVGDAIRYSLDEAIQLARQTGADEVDTLVSISHPVEIPEDVAILSNFEKRLTGAISGTGSYKMINTPDMTSSSNWNRSISSWFGAGSLSNFNGTLWFVRGRFNHNAPIEGGRVKLKVTDGAQLFVEGGTWTNPIEISGNGMTFERYAISAAAIRVDAATYAGPITAVVTGEDENKIIPSIGTHNATAATFSGDITAPDGLNLFPAEQGAVVSVTGNLTGKFVKIGSGEVKIKTASEADIKVSTGTLRLNESTIGNNVNFEIVSGAKLECYGWPTFNGPWSITTDTVINDVFKNSGANAIKALAGQQGGFTKYGMGTIIFDCYFGEDSRPYSGNISLNEGSVEFKLENALTLSSDAKVIINNDKSSVKVKTALPEGQVIPGDNKYIVVSNEINGLVVYSLIVASVKVEIPTIEGATIGSVTSGGTKVEVNEDGGKYYVDAKVNQKLVVTYQPQKGMYIKNGVVSIVPTYDGVNKIDISGVEVSNTPLANMPVVIKEKKGTKIRVEGLSEDGCATSGSTIIIYVALREGYENLKVWVGEGNDPSNIFDIFEFDSKSGYWKCEYPVPTFLKSVGPFRTDCDKITE